MPVFTQALKLLPEVITLNEAGNLFEKANRMGDVSDNDLHELNFDEFQNLMQDIAKHTSVSVAALLLSRRDLCGRMSLVQWFRGCS